MIAYRNELEKRIDENRPETDWQKENKFFESKFFHLQTERLIHLLVTLTVGLATIISCFVTMISQIFPLFVLDGIFMILFFAYILHYRKLENTAQSWYSLQDKLRKKII